MPELRRSLRLRDLVAIGINGVIGTGIFFLPGYAAEALGPAALWTFLISAALCSLLVVCFAEVGSRFEGTGGPVLYSQAAFGEWVGFGVGWLSWVVRVTAWGALSNALVDALGVLIPLALDYRSLILVALFSLLAAINIAGVEQAALMTNVFTVAKLLPILAFVGIGLFHLDLSLFQPFAPHGYSAIGSSTLVILYAFVGFEVLTVPAGEAVDPTSSVPRALLLTMGVVTVLYLLIWVVCAGTLPTLSGSANPVAEAAATFLGPVGTTLVSLGILLSVVGINSGSALVTPRVLYALARAGSVPRILGWTHSNRHTPVVAILVSAVVTLIVALSGSFVELAVLSVVARFGQYIPTVIALPWLRRMWPDRPPRYRARFGPVLALLALVLCLWLLAQAEPRQLGWGVLALAAGYVLHIPMRLGRDPSASRSSRTG